MVTNVRPIIVQSRVMLPVRAVFEALDANVNYSQSEQKITAKRLSTTVEFVIGSNIMTVNGEAREIDVAPIVVNNRTLVPVRACSEAFDLDVEWDAKAGAVRIRKPVSMLEKNSWGRSEYDDAGRLSYKLVKNLSDYGDKWENLSPANEYYYKYDEYGNPVEEMTYYNGSFIYKYVYTNTYDDKCRLVKYVRDEYTSYSTSKPVETDVYTIKYNDYNQPLIKEGTDGFLQTWEYNENGQLLHMKRNISPYEQELRYDENGNVVYDNNPHETVFTEYNELGQKVIEKVYFSGADLNGTPTAIYEYKYDAEGRVTEMKTVGVTKKYTYNELGLKINEHFTTEGGSFDQTYNYDENGNLISIYQGNVFIETYTVVYK